MSNRFSTLPQYHRLVLGHGILAAIVFLLIVPSAILIARFYHRNPRLALRLHIWLQILTVGLTTVILILGWFAVGPDRSLTNPHHGIGVALYTLVLVQAIGGSLIHHFEKGRMRYRLPLKLILHQWLGRAIAVLGVVQIALGLTLYGSPKYLFILYSLVAFAWLLLYFILNFINRPTIADDGSEYDSYVSEPTRTEMTEDRRSRQSNNHGLRNTALFGAGLAGLSALRHRSRSRQRGEEAIREDRTDVTQSRRGSRPPASHTDAEKYSAQDNYLENHTWRNRLLGAGVGLGAYEGAKRFFNRRKTRDEESDVGAYQAPPSGVQSVSRTDVSRVQDGQAPMSPGDSRLSRASRPGMAAMASPTQQQRRRRRSEDSLISGTSRESLDDEPPLISEGGHGIRAGIATLGVLGFLRERQRQRRENKEQQRIDEMRRLEKGNANRINRANSRRYGPGRRRTGTGESIGTTGYSMGGSEPEMPQQYPRQTTGPPLPAYASALPASTEQLDQSYVTNFGHNTPSEIPAPSNTNTMPPINNPGYPVAPSSINMPQAAVEPNPSYLTEARNHSRTRLSHGRQGRRNSGSQIETLNSPTTIGSHPVSVKVQMQKDGRHVTLRRLNEQEAAAERHARIQEPRQRRRRAESLSSGVDDGTRRFRRSEGVRPSAEMPIANVPPPPPMSRRDELHLPSPTGPPPVPIHSLSPQGGVMNNSHMTASGLTSGVGSPGTYETGTGTDLSAFDSNRKRRRMERAAAKNQRAAQQGSRVEFT